MLSILLIDDEDLELEGLETMICGMNLNFRVCGKARNAAQGIKLAQELNPDVILSDVKMPKMDGIEMAKKIQELGIKTFLVFISGYQDFTAAQEAISLGARSYLLKPVNCDSLRDVLLQASDSLEKNRQERSRRQEVDNSLERLADLDKRVVLKRIMSQNSMSEAEILQQMEKVGLPCRRGYYAVCLLKAKRENSAEIVLGEEAKGSLAYVARKHNAFRPVMLSEEEIGILFYFPGFVMEEQVLSQLLTAGDNLLSEARYTLGDCVNIGISGISSSLEMVSDLTDQARKALEQAFYFGKGRVVLYEGEETESQIPNEFSEEVKAVFSAVTDGAPKEALEAMKKLFDQDILSSREIVSNTCIDMISFSQKLLKEAGLTQKEDGNDSSFYVKLMQQNTFDETFAFMTDYIVKLCEQFVRRRQKQGNALVEQIEQIIQKECHTQLSIDSIADRVYMSPSYISRVFKNQTGETILDHLQSVRMKKALEYLGMPQYHIYEIGTMVGYENPSYFAMVFKKYYGMTPKKYREQLNIYENS